MVQIKRVNMGWDPVGTSIKVSGWFEGPFEQLATGNEVENFEKKIRIFFDLHRVPPVKMKKNRKNFPNFQKIKFLFATRFRHELGFLRPLEQVLRRK